MGDDRIDRIVDVSVPGSAVRVHEVHLTPEGRAALEVPDDTAYDDYFLAAIDEDPCTSCGETDVFDPATGMCDTCTRRKAALAASADRASAPGYHLRRIEKGVLGTASKVREEAEELVDAEEQGVVIMQLVELADLYGAMRAMVERLGHTMADLERMSDVTARAFRNGKR